MPSPFDPELVNNPFALRRFGNIFGGGQQNQGLGGFRDYGFLKADEPADPVMNARTSQTTDPYGPYVNPYRGQAAEAYRSHLAAMPDQADYQPSKTRRLGAALTAAAAAFGRNPNAAEMGANVRDANYRGAMNEWGLKGAGLKEQASIEAQDVKGQLDYAKFVREQAQKDREHELNVRKAESDIANNQSLANYRTAQIENLKQQGWKEMYSPKGELIYVNPATGERRSFGMSFKGTELGLDLDRLADQQARTQYMGQNAQTYARGVDASIDRANQQGYIGAEEQFKADASAVMNVLKAHPEWKGWVKGGNQVKGPGDYWGSAPTQQTPGYKEFLAAVEAEKRRILNQRRSGGVPMPPGGLPGAGGVLNFDDLEEGK